MEREHSIDVAKGVLMCAVIWGHLGYHSQRLLESSHGISFYYAQFEISNWLYQPYYMCGFFFISGMFDRMFLIKDIWKSAKALFTLCIVTRLVTGILPSLITGELQNIPSIFFANFSWFIVALFWIKVISLFFNKLTNRLIKMNFEIKKVKCFCLLSALVLHVVGLYLVESDQSYYYCGEGLFFFIYYFSGRFHELYKKYSISLLFCIYFSSVAICRLIGTLPNLQGNLSVTYTQLPFELLMGLSGSLLLIGIIKHFGRCKLLEIIGRRSLALCVLASIIQCFFIKQFGPFFCEKLNSCGYIIELFWLFLNFVLPIVIILMICKLLDRKYLRWVLGKW